MKKSNIRDYGVSAFRFYALLSKNKKATVFPENSRLKSGCILDIIAVEKTFKMLESLPEGEEIIRAVKIVYFTMPEKNLKKGEISDRVQRAATELHIGEATVYRFLNKALIFFAQSRGLRISLF